MNNLSEFSIDDLREMAYQPSNTDLVRALARELLALREAGKEAVAATTFKPVADLYEMQFADGSTMAFHTDAAKAAQWLNTCDGNKVQEYVTLERFQQSYAAPQLPAVPELVPVPDEFLSAEQNQHGMFQLSEDCMVRLASALAQQSKGLVVPPGWVMVPRKITLEMECALSRADSYEIGWLYAIAAAPKPE